MARTIGRKELARVIHRRLDSLPMSEIYTALGVIVEEVKELLVDGPVTVKNFGTLTGYEFHGHLYGDVHTGEVQELEKFQTVRFHPASAFMELLEERRRSFSNDSEG